MKQRFLDLLLILAVLFGASAAVNAQSKELEKNVKKTVKEWKKAGWSMLASSTTMEYALLKYRTYIEADEDNHDEIGRAHV